MVAPLPLRTRLFALVADRFDAPLDEVPPEDIPARRTGRAKLLGGTWGQRLVSGVPHPDAVVEDVLADVEPRKVAGLPDALAASDAAAEPVTLRVRTYRPAPAEASGPLPLVVLYHGGGWVMGDPEQDEWWATRLAVETPCVVASVAYRLAPEHPYPAAVVDAWAALDWAITHAEELGADPARVFVAGDSAGGNLAAVVADLAGEAGAPQLAGQLLIYPATEMIDTFPSEREFAEAPVLTSRGMKAYSRLYLAGDDGTAPSASPLRGSLAGAKTPALVQVAGHDPLRDNGVLYAQALRERGGEVVFEEYDDAVHGYISLPGISPSAPRALAGIVAFVREHSQAASSESR